LYAGNNTQVFERLSEDEAINSVSEGDITFKRFGPSYQRRSHISDSPGILIEGEGHLVDRSQIETFSEGDRVFHQKFGMGTINSVDGDKLSITFDKAGEKKVIARFVSRP
jgi:DNA helicase-2/ATP-dependent DNA helicase PcrA